MYAPIKNLGKGPRIRLNMTPEEAKKVGNDLRLALVTKIKEPCFVVRKGRHPPTIDYPDDVSWTDLGLVGADTEWLIYRASTKEILKRGRYN